jgi:hypothetical protein
MARPSLEVAFDHPLRRRFIEVPENGPKNTMHAIDITRPEQLKQPASIGKLVVIDKRDEVAGGVLNRSISDEANTLPRFRAVSHRNC